jgi:hypothetical protein
VAVDTVAFRVFAQGASKKTSSKPVVRVKAEGGDIEIQQEPVENPGADGGDGGPVANALPPDSLELGILEECHSKYVRLGWGPKGQYLIHDGTGEYFELAAVPNDGYWVLGFVPDSEDPTRLRGYLVSRTKEGKPLPVDDSEPEPEPDLVSERLQYGLFTKAGASQVPFRLCLPSWLGGMRCRWVYSPRLCGTVVLWLGPWKMLVECVV